MSQKFIFLVSKVKKLAISLYLALTSFDTVLLKEKETIWVAGLGKLL